MNNKSLIFMAVLILNGCDTYKGQIKHDPNHHDDKKTEKKAG